MNKLQKFEYNGCMISFEIGNGVMANATEMAKYFGKQPIEWLKYKQSSGFIEELSKLRNISLADLVQVNRGGVNPGTWLHEDVALEFARWLSPSFAIWCNDRIKELIKHGATALNPEDLLDPDFIINLATELKKERQANELHREKLKLQENVIKEAAPKVEYYENVLQSESLISTNVIAKDMGMSAPSLNKLLNKLGIIYKSGSTWVLYHRWQSFGYTKSRTYDYMDRTGIKQTAIHMYWTEEGREFIMKTIKEYKEKYARALFG